ncbi:hypothetical protein ONE63_001937 [Megalurothrips usitatus]|uniref:DUF4218 domain-containing protein n=1 Tax=Megalurothrips usitatus TaxID=439358 RepID=A0AAV7XEA3_9NEOP|nr:hypothetical protein ONE63_001937 [Megalurothrips usitatus]
MIIAERNEVPREDQEIADPEQFVRQQLLEWTLAGGVSMSKVDDLLKRLKPVHPNLPLSYKTLVQTPKHIHVADCGNGSMWYYGIVPQLSRQLGHDYFVHHNEVLIDVNIDSLPIFDQGRKTNFVPILGRLADSSEVFIIGIFCGNGSDPQNMDVFLADYVEEVNMLRSNGFVFENIAYNFDVRHYILDQKARASVKCVKGVRGYFCCEKCTVRGVDYMQRMCLLDQNCVLRTDESLVDMAASLMMPKREHYDDDETDEHVIGVSPLFKCENRLVSKFRLDSMHLVYKGVFLRWLDFLWNGRGAYSLSPQKKAEISDTLNSFRHYCPSDFNRKPFAIKSVKLKATELRRILLYDGIVLFKKLDHNLYKNFLLLHCGIFILCSPTLCAILNDEANDFLRSFVTHAEEIFGTEFIVYNVHSLVHLALECKEHGALDGFGAFPFENCLGGIKQRIFSRSKPLQEMAKREIERSRRPKKFNPPERQLQMPCLNDENEPVAGPQFKKIVVKGATLATKGPDSCCEMTDGSVVQVQNIIAAENGTIIVGKKFSRTMDFYEYPIPSSLLGIRKVSDLLACSTYWTPEDVKNKCYLLPLNDNEYVSVPLLHCT